MRFRKAVLSLVLLCAISAECAREAGAAELIIQKPFTGRRRNIELNVHGTIAYGYGGFFYNRLAGYYGGYGLGPGVQMLFPVVQNGFIPGLNNAFYVGFFSELLWVPYFARFSDGFVGLPLGPMVQWRFWLFEQLSVFNNLGFGVGPAFDSRYGTTIMFWPLFELGANWHFHKSISLTATIGYPSIKVGVNFGF